MAILTNIRLGESEPSFWDKVMGGFYQTTKDVLQTFTGERRQKAELEAQVAIAKAMGEKQALQSQARAEALRNVAIYGGAAAVALGALYFYFKSRRS